MKQSYRCYQRISQNVIWFAHEWRRRRIDELTKTACQCSRQSGEPALRRMRRLVEAFGFRMLHVSASHHIFGRTGMAEQVNLQEVGGKAKPYQVRQFLKLVERYNLQLEDN